MAVLRLVRMCGGEVSALTLMECTGLGTGRLYPALAKLRDQGFIEGVTVPLSDPPRVVYRLKRGVT